MDFMDFMDFMSDLSLRSWPNLCQHFLLLLARFDPTATFHFHEIVFFFWFQFWQGNSISFECEGNVSFGFLFVGKELVEPRVFESIFVILFSWGNLCIFP